MKNLLFFLTPKNEVAHVREDESLRQVLEKMEHHGYSAVPLLSVDGRYIGTLTDGDVLWCIKELGFPNLKVLENYSVMEIKRARDNKPVHICETMEGLLEKVAVQNFVPVVDDGRIFIGIVTRGDVINYLARKRQEIQQ